VQQLGILVYSSPTGTLEPSRGDIDVSVDKVCNCSVRDTTLPDRPISQVTYSHVQNHDRRGCK